jgi:hypothetical protein
VSVVASPVERLVQQALLQRVAPPPDEVLEIECPNLWELLTLDQYAPGKPRLLSELVITRVPGAFQVVLKDHDTGQQKGCLSLTLENMSEQLEKALLDPLVPWLPFKSYKNKQGLKKFDEKKA